MQNEIYFNHFNIIIILFCNNFVCSFFKATILLFIPGLIFLANLDNNKNNYAMGVGLCINCFILFAKQVFFEQVFLGRLFILA